ncbi:MAG: replication initiator protein [Microviridae sp.]|nr:MAG: replication initiator protein [Microviridae sp.]
MPCYRPLLAFHNAEHGAVYWHESQRNGLCKQISLPCGQCIGCRLQRAHEWATRCMHEAQLHTENCFITLTYNKEKLQTQSLVHRDYQLCMKRLRNALGRIKYANAIAISESLYETADMGLCPIPQLQYYMAGEYGTKTRRPHFHACLFGINFADRQYWQRTSSGSKLYISATLQNIWPHGFSSIGDVNYESAAYIARYIMTKQTGHSASKYYEHVDITTGEITNLKPEYNKMSLRKGIGRDWLKLYLGDVYPKGTTVRKGGQQTKAPKFYDKIYQAQEPDKYEAMKMDRETQALEYRSDNTPERLRTKERVKLASINQLLREL